LTNHHLHPDNEAIAKFYGKVPLEFASCMFYFSKNGISRELIHGLKYRAQQDIGSVLGAWQAEDLKSLTISNTFDEIIPVPLHKKKLRKRGFNQVTTYGHALSESLQILYNPLLLKRLVNNKSQAGKNLLNRSEVISTIFEANFTENDHNKHFLLIDDVLTTGATLEACSKALLKIPGAKISIACLAMAHR